MALALTGGIVAKALKPVLVPSSFATPNTLNLQVRYAARKGYRQVKQQKKKQQNINQSTTRESYKTKLKMKNIERTVEPNKPEPPSDDVFIKDMFKAKKYSMVEATIFHKQYHHPTVFNNPDAPIIVKIEFDMTAKKKTQFLKPFRGLASMPNPFHMGMKREILVLCEPEYVEPALKCGATLVGGLDIVAKIKQGVVIPNLFEFIICHTKFFPEITPIRGLLSTQLPRAKTGTLTTNLTEAIPRFLYGIEYKCIKVDKIPDLGVVECTIGTSDMEPEKVEENLKALLSDINQFRPNREGAFVTYITCKSPPSMYEYVIDVERYVDTVKEDDEMDDEPDTPDSEMKDVKEYLREVEREKIEKELLK